MHINIKKIAEGTSSYKTTLVLPVELSENGGVVCDVPAEVVVRRLAAQLFVEVNYTATINRECGRCLESFVEKVEACVEFILLPEGDEDMETDHVDCYFYESEEDVVDFSQTLYDDIMVQVPISALCSKDCPGFSVEESVEPEVEEVTDVDPRWAALDKLRNRN